MRTPQALVPLGLAIPVLISAATLASDPNGSRTSSRPSLTNAAWSKQTIHETAHGLGHVSVAADGPTGEIWITWFDFTASDLGQARNDASAGNCGPVSSWTCWSESSAYDIGRYNSVAIRSGPERIDYIVPFFDATAGWLEYLEGYFLDGGGSSSALRVLDKGTPVLEDETGMYTAVAFGSDGNPHVAYHAGTGTDAAGTHFMYAHRVVDSSGNCGWDSVASDWQCDVIESHLHTGSIGATTLTLGPGDSPAVAYWDSSRGQILVATYLGSGGSCGPSNQWSCFHLMEEATIGPSISLITRGYGNVHLAYQNASSGMLEVAHPEPIGLGNCGEWLHPPYDWQCDAIAPMGTITATRTVAMVADPSNRPVVAFRDAHEDLAPSLLKVARPLVSLPPGTAGNCGPVNTWYCETVDGGIHREEADTIAMATDGKGTIYIAYHEYDDYDLEHRIRLASAFVGIFNDGFESGGLSAWSSAAS